MNRFFIIAVLLSISAILCSAAPSTIDEQPIRELIERASLFGINIPDFLTSIPGIGSLITNGVNVISNSTAAVFKPASDLLGFLTGGLLSRTGSIFPFLDKISGGALSTISGDGGFKWPIFDSLDLFNIGKNVTTGVAGAAAAIQLPIFKLLGIPGDVAGNILKSFDNVVKSIPWPIFGPPPGK